MLMKTLFALGALEPGIFCTLLGNAEPFRFRPAGPSNHPLGCCLDLDGLRLLRVLISKRSFLRWLASVQEQIWLVRHGSCRTSGDSVAQ